MCDEIIFAAATQIPFSFMINSYSLFRSKDGSPLVVKFKLIRKVF